MHHGGREGRAGHPGLVRAVAAAVFLQWAGNNAMLPLLPIDVRSRGGSDAVVGAVMAAYFAAAVVAQYPAGRLADRLGRLPVLLAGQGTYAAGALLFLLPVSPTLDVAFRALQGAGAGAAEVAALAMVARAVPAERRGRAFGTVYGAGLGGMAVGPLLGSLAGTRGLPLVFTAAAVAALVACVPVLAATRRMGERRAPVAAAGPEHGDGAGPANPRGALPAGDGPGGPAAGSAGPPTGALARLRLHPAMAGSLVAAAVIGGTSGLYEACWTLLLHHRGAADWQIGLSWTLYALPYVAMSRPAGWLADHLDRRRLVVASLLWVLVFCGSYPFVPSVPWLLALAVGESAGFVLALPAAQSLLGERAAPEEAGRVQGLFAASQTGATAVAAATTGALFGLATWLPFEVVAGCCLVAVGAAALVWRPVPGRVVPQRGRVARETSRTAPGGGVAPLTLAGGPDERGDGPEGSTA